MKIKFLLISVFFSILTGCCEMNGYFMSTPGPCSQCSTCSQYTDCDCADPTCRCGYGNPCLDKKTCCESFGNIGASSFTQSCHNKRRVASHCAKNQSKNGCHSFLNYF